MSELRMQSVAAERVKKFYGRNTTLTSTATLTQIPINGESSDKSIRLAVARQSEFLAMRIN